MKEKKIKENNTVNQVLQHLAKSIGFTNVAFKTDAPDIKERNLPACDFITKLGSRKLVIEHTTIDSVSNQRRDDGFFSRLIVPLETPSSIRLLN